MGRALRYALCVGTPAAWAVAIAMVCIHVLGVAVLTTGAGAVGGVTLLGEHTDKSLLIRTLADLAQTMRDRRGK